MNPKQLTLVGTFVAVSLLSGCSSFCSTCSPAPVESRAVASAPVYVPAPGNSSSASARPKCSSDIRQAEATETLGKVWTLSAPLPSDFTDGDRKNIVAILGLPSTAAPTFYESKGKFLLVSAMPKYWDNGNECRIFRAERGTIPDGKNWKTDRIDPETIVVRSVCKMRLQGPNPMYGSSC